MDKQFILPGTGNKINISFKGYEDFISFNKIYGYEIAKLKPNNVSWNDYDIWLLQWLNNGTIDQVNESGRQDLKLLWVLFRNAKLTKDNRVVISYTMKDANRAIQMKNLPLLEKILNTGIRPGMILVNSIYANNKTEFIKLFLRQNPPIFPNVDGANAAASNGDLQIIEFLSLQNPPILPDSSGADFAAGRGHLNILQFLAQQNPPILPTERGATEASLFNFNNVVEWLGRQNPPILPNRDLLTSDISSEILSDEEE